MVLFPVSTIFTPTLKLFKATSYLWVGLLGIREELCLAWGCTAPRQGHLVCLEPCLGILWSFQFSEYFLALLK